MNQNRLDEIKIYLDEIHAVSVKYNTANKTTLTYEIAIELVYEVERLRNILSKMHYLDE